jgi:hypothetical protein
VKSELSVTPARRQEPTIRGVRRFLILHARHDHRGFHAAATNSWRHYRQSETTGSSPVVFSPTKTVGLRRTGPCSLAMLQVTVGQD